MQDSSVHELAWAQPPLGSFERGVTNCDSFGMTLVPLLHVLGSGVIKLWGRKASKLLGACTGIVFVMDGDEAATLEATLAFLDECDTSTTDNESANGSPSAGRSSPKRKQQQARAEDVAAPASSRRKKPRRKYPNSSSTVLQRRKKAEILALRVEVEQLETQLEQLKNVPGATLALAGDTALALQQKAARGTLTFQEQAALQCRARLEAEKTNSRLKSMVTRQVQASEALRNLLQQTAAMAGMDFLQQDPYTLLVDSTACTMAMLERRVDGLYLESDEVFRPDLLKSISVEASTKQSQSLGKTVEILSTTPMMCSLKGASDLLWKWLSITERNYTLVLESPIGPLEFRQQNIVRRFEEDGRVVIVWADTVQLPKYQMQFRNQCWLFITPSADAPKDASVLRSFQQLFVDREASQPVEASPFVQEIVFRELSNMYRHFLQSQQNEMLNKSRPVRRPTNIST
ncbi:unnamed protein product [Phytophthora fragariaefolia]|uniref:Unnamed protein product n=1 Tax=Phytophthora fragariaefolia TaxID=1490495 RepID=A0A9W6YEY2_9STRA|nr:unnamed protein product [Phytophthora fragariaefolia]